MRGRRPPAWTGAIIAALAAAAPASSQVQGQAPGAAPQRGIDWQAAVAATRRTANQGPALASSLDPAAIDRTRAPILLPDDKALMSGARLYSFGDYYTVTADMPGGGVSLSGTTTTVTAPKALTVAPQGGETLVVQRTVDGHLASFVRFGVLYTAEVRCDAPSDERCRSEALVRQLVTRSTVVVLGKAARQVAGLGG